MEHYGNQSQGDQDHVEHIRLAKHRSRDNAACTKCNLSGAWLWAFQKAALLSCLPVDLLQSKSYPVSCCACGCVLLGLLNDCQEEHFGQLRIKENTCWWFWERNDCEQRNLLQAHCERLGCIFIHFSSLLRNFLELKCTFFALVLDCLYCC